jgi:hypothetical protein
LPSGKRSYNSVGRVPDLHSGCRRFKSVWEHDRFPALPWAVYPLSLGAKAGYNKGMKLLLAMAVLFTVPTLAAPQCVAVHDRICFESQSEYDRYMGWSSKQQQLETEANN